MQAAARIATVLVALLAAGCETDDLLGPLDGGADVPAGLSDGSSAAACGFSEPEPNDEADQATAYSPGQNVRGCIGGRGDVDLFALSAPALPAAGGYFQASLTDVGTGQLEIAVLSASDDGRLLAMVRTFDEGAPLHFYWAAAPGQRYRVSVSHFGGGSQPFAYRFQAAFTAIDDPYEPNDVPEQARALLLGETVRPYLFAGFAGQDIAADAHDDWFEVELGARLVTIALPEVPADVGPQLRLYDAAGSERASRLNSEPGGTVTLTAPVTSPGSYRVRVSIFSVRPASAGESRTAGAVPASFTRPYALTITQ